MAAAPLVVISPAYVAPFETGYALQEKIFSLADSFDITDMNGVPMFKLQGHVISLRDTKTLLDRYGQPVAVMRRKLISLHGTWEIYSGDGRNLLASVKAKLLTLKSHATVIIHQFGEEPYLTVKGDFLAKNFRILRGDTIVASVQRKSIFKDAVKLFTGNDSYSLTVKPNVDQAFAVALAVTFDAMFNSDNQ